MWLAAGTVALSGLATSVQAVTAQADTPGLERSDFDGDGSSDLVVGAPTTSSSAGAVSVLPGGAGGPGAQARKTVSQNTGSVPGSSEAGDRFGADTASGDVDGDGKLDLVVGAPGEDDTRGNADRGSVTILTGSSGLASGTSFTTGSDDARSPNSARLGTAVATGDFNGDGRDDVVAVGLGTGDNGGWLTWRNSATGATTTERLSFSGLTHADVATGDFNGDGYDDVAVTTVDRYGTGRAYEYQSSGANGLANSMAIQMSGGRTIDAGDVNGDGRDDIVIGQPVASETGSTGYSGGQVTVKFGQDYGLYYQGHTVAINQSTAGVPGAAEAGDSMGSSVALRDDDGDGALDIVTGLPGEDLTVSGVARKDAGSALVMRLASDGADALSVTEGTSLNQGAGGIGGAAESGDRMGSAVAGGDFSGNGSTGLVIGASGENSGDGTAVHRTAAGTSSYVGRSAAGTPSGGGLGSILAP